MQSSDKWSKRAAKPVDIDGCSFSQQTTPPNAHPYTITLRMPVNETSNMYTYFDIRLSEGEVRNMSRQLKSWVSRADAVADTVTDAVEGSL